MLCPAFVSLSSNCALETHLGVIQLLIRGKDIICWAEETQWEDGTHSLPVSKDDGNKAPYELQLCCTAMICFHPSKDYHCIWFSSKIRTRDSSRSGGGGVPEEKRDNFLNLTDNS